MLITQQKYTVIFADEPQATLAKITVFRPDAIIRRGQSMAVLAKTTIFRPKVILWRNTERWARLVEIVNQKPRPYLFDSLRTDRHMIGGTITAEGQPAKRVVIAYSRKNMKYVAGTYSDPETGEWSVSGLLEHPERSLLVVALDNTDEYNAQVADYITQVAPNPPEVEEPEA